jgi:hypothetical protein
MVRNPMKGAIIFLIEVLSFQFFYKTLGRIHINLLIYEFHIFFEVDFIECA